MGNTYIVDNRTGCRTCKSAIWRNAVRKKNLNIANKTLCFVALIARVDSVKCEQVQETA